MASKGRGFGSFLFGVIILLLVVLWFIPAPAIKWGIETYGSEHVGAKVDVRDVNFSWLSAALSIEGLQVTNPDSPMENMLVVDLLATAVDVGQLLNKKVYFDELAVEGIALGEARTESGALGPRPVVESTEDEGGALTSLGLPSADELVAQEKAIYANKIQAYRDKLTAKKAALEQAIQGLPNDESLASFKDRIQKAKDNAKGPLGKFAALKEFKRIKKDIKKDVNKVKEVQSLIKSTIADLEKDYAVLKGLPDQSASEIVKTLGLEKSVVANAGQTLLSGRFESWIQEAVGYYGAASGGAPGSEDKAGTETGEQTVKTTPDFLIKRMLLSGRLRQGEREGEMNGVILNLNEAPSLLPDPITVDLKAAGVDFGKLVLKGTVDHRTMGKEIDVFDLSITDSSLENYSLTNQPDMSLLLKKAVLSTQAKASIRTLSTLDVNVDAVFNNIDLAVSQGDSGETTEPSDTQKAVVDALKGAKDINFQGTATGPLNNPKLTLSSNLDGVLSKAIGKAVQGKIDALKGEVAQKLQAEIAEQLAPLKGSLNNLSGLGSQAGERKGAIDALLQKL